MDTAIGIPDNANHTFVSPIKDFPQCRRGSRHQRRPMYTDTYSTAHPGLQPRRPGNHRHLHVSPALGSGWTPGFDMWFRHGRLPGLHLRRPSRSRSTAIVQNWAFKRRLSRRPRFRFFNLDQNVVDSNQREPGALTIINRPQTTPG